MNKYILDEKIDKTYNASSKARDDVSLFVQSYTDRGAYFILGSNDKRKINTKIGKCLIGIRAICDIFFHIKSGDILFLQSSFKIVRLINIIKKVKKFKTIYLIHDLDSLRDSYDNKRNNDYTIRLLNRQDVLICHNLSMVQELKRRGCRVKMVSLDIFDYYCNNENDSGPRILSQKRICFAGNLNPNKTGFLYLLDKNPLKSYEIEVYGRKVTDFLNLHYCGCFAPEELPGKLDGEFGLIWEGSDFSYNESQHPYIMFNNPHKASLYIVARLPIIIWKKAAIAEFVQKEGIGIVIDCIQDIEKVLKSISPEKYNAMQINLARVRQQIISGSHIHTAIREAEKLLVK